jgi:hypothetical protein
VKRWESDGIASENEDGEEKAGFIGALDEDGGEKALITNRRRWKWRWRWSRERHVMEVKKESEGSYVALLILDSQYLGDSYSNSGKPPVVASSSSVSRHRQV